MSMVFLTFFMLQYDKYYGALLIFFLNSLQLLFSFYRKSEKIIHFIHPWHFNRKILIYWSKKINSRHQKHKVGRPFRYRHRCLHPTPQRGIPGYQRVKMAYWNLNGFDQMSAWSIENVIVSQVGYYPCVINSSICGDKEFLCICAGKLDPFHVYLK